MNTQDGHVALVEYQVVANADLKATMLKEVKDSFNTPPYRTFSISTENIVNTFFEFIDFNTNNESFAGLPNIVTKQLYISLVNNASNSDLNNALRTLATSLDPFLKKIIYIIDKPKYNLITSNRSGLKHVIDGSRIFASEPINALYNESLRSADISNYQDFIIKSYKYRNTVHEAPDLNQNQLFDKLLSVLIVYLFGIAENYEAISNYIAFNETHNPYFNRIISENSKWKDTYVTLDSNEITTGINEILNPTAIEILSDIETDSSQIKSGAILGIFLEEHRIVLLGPPGVGKSTTLKFIAYQEATSKSKLPIYIELKDYDGNNSIEHIITEEIGLSQAELQVLLKTNRVCLLLDGLNEILIKESSIAARGKIRGFIAKYPEISLIITSRQQSYNNDFERLKVFELQSMSDEQIETLLQKHLADNSASVYLDIKSKAHLHKLAKNPLMLTIIIAIANSSEGKIPQNKGLLIKSFINYLLQREKSKNILLDIDEINIIMASLAYGTRKIGKLTFTKGFAIEYVKGKFNDIPVKTINLIINTLIDINLFTSKKDNLSFSHEVFQEYFCAQRLLVLQELGHSYLDVLENNTFQAWDEPIVILAGISSTPVSIIENLVSTSIVLAAKCYNQLYSTNNETKLLVTQKSIQYAKDIQNISLSVAGLTALVELEEFQVVSDLLSITSNIRVAHAYRGVLEKMFQELNQDDIPKILETITQINPAFFIGPILNALETRVLDNSFFLNNHKELADIADHLISYQVSNNDYDKNHNNFKIKHLARYIIYFQLKNPYYQSFVHEYVSNLIKGGNVKVANNIINALDLSSIFDDEKYCELLLKKGSNTTAYAFYEYVANCQKPDLINKGLLSEELHNQAAALLLSDIIDTNSQFSIIFEKSALYSLGIINTGTNRYFKALSVPRKISAIVEDAAKRAENRDLNLSLLNKFDCRIISPEKDGYFNIAAKGIKRPCKIMTNHLPKRVNLNKAFKKLKALVFECELIGYTKETAYFSGIHSQIIQDMQNRRSVEADLVSYDRDLTIVIPSQGITGTIPSKYIPNVIKPYLKDWHHGSLEVVPERININGKVIFKTALNSKFIKEATNSNTKKGKLSNSIDNNKLSESAKNKKSNLSDFAQLLSKAIDKEPS